MKKLKVLVLALVLGAGITMGTHAIGFGAQFNANASSVFTPGVSLAFSFTHRVHTAFNWYFGDNTTIGITGDYWIFNPALVKFNSGSFRFHLGAGLYTNIIFADDTDWTGGIRFPVGFNLLVLKDFLEVYINVAPSVGIQFYPSFAMDKFFFPIALGARIWLFG